MWNLWLKKGKTTNFFPCFCCCSWVLDPRSGIQDPVWKKNQDLVFGINIPYPQHCPLLCSLSSLIPYKIKNRFTVTFFLNFFRDRHDLLGTEKTCQFKFIKLYGILNFIAPPDSSSNCFLLNFFIYQRWWFWPCLLVKAIRWTLALWRSAARVSHIIFTPAVSRPEVNQMVKVMFINFIEFSEMNFLLQVKGIRQGSVRDRLPCTRVT